MIDGERLLDVLHDLGFDGEFAEDDTEIRIACPLCADDNKRLYIEAESGAWLCFRCDVRGGLFDLFNEALGLGARESFEKMREVRFRHGQRYRFAGLEEADEEPAKVELPDQFVRFTAMYASTERPYAAYLDGRGVNAAMRSMYGMGYCAAGPYAGRLIIPVYGAPDNTLYTFVARSIDPNVPVREKVLYPPHSRPSETLFNLDRVLLARDYRPFPQLVLAEGVFDALVLPGNAVAILGSHLSETQMDLLAGLGAEWHPFVVCMDGDEAGRRASRSIMRQLWSNMLPAVEALLPDGTDPASAPRSVLLDTISDALRNEYRNLFTRRGK